MNIVTKTFQVWHVQARRQQEQVDILKEKKARPSGFTCIFSHDQYMCKNNVCDMCMRHHQEQPMSTVWAALFPC
jgi:alpha-D-ribose 1-methylphosphonate 5-triphosphate synthase subunit PhnL